MLESPEGNFFAIWLSENRLPNCRTPLPLVTNDQIIFEAFGGRCLQEANLHGDMCLTDEEIVKAVREEVQR